MSREKITLCAIIALSFLTKLQNLGRVLAGIFPGYDSYYHLRLAEVIVKAGFRPDFDYYLNYPYGLKIGWPPLYDYIISVPGVLFGYHATEMFAALFPPILGVVSTFLVYLMGKKIIQNEFFAQLSALIFAFTPSVVSISVAGFADYHIWNLFLIVLALYITTLRSPFEVLTSIPLTLLSFSWMGAPIYAAAVALSALFGYEERKLNFLAIGFAIPAVSWVYKPFISLSFIALAVFILLGAQIKKRYDLRGLVFYTLSMLVLAASLYFLPIGHLELFKAGINYLLGLSVYLPTIGEAKSFDVGSIIYYSGAFIILLAFAGLLLLRNHLVTSLFLISLSLSLLQIRFADLLSLPTAFLSAYTICLALERLEFPVFEKKDEGKRKISGKRKKRGKAKVKEVRVTKGDWAVVVVFIALMLTPSLIVSIRPVELNKDWEMALKWIKDNTEPTSYYLQPDNKPEYSILSWWDYGNWIVYVSKRPVVANNFQAGAIDAAKFFTSQNESDALKIIRKRGVKYIITAKDMGLGEKGKEGKFTAIMQIAGLNPFFMNKTEIMDFYNNSIYYKLHFEDAKDLKNFELVRDFGEVKVFKVV